MGVSENLRMETTPPPGTSVPMTDAQTKRSRNLGDDAQNRLATVFTACALAENGRYDSPQAGNPVTAAVDSVLAGPVPLVEQ